MVVALTSPPLVSFLGAWLARFWRASFFYWVMDFNPDESIAAGWLKRGSLPARVLDSMSLFSLRRASKIIALDYFMRDRICAKGISPNKVAVIPPWSHDDDVQFDPSGRDRFRKAHALSGKFVVMSLRKPQPGPSIGHPVGGRSTTAGRHGDRLLLCRGRERVAQD